MSECPPTEIPRAPFRVNLKDPVEIRYLKAMLGREYPAAPSASINAAVAECATAITLFESREKLLECARGILEKSLSP